MSYDRELQVKDRDEDGNHQLECAALFKWEQIKCYVLQQKVSLFAYLSSIVTCRPCKSLRIQIVLANGTSSKWTSSVCEMEIEIEIKWFSSQQHIYSSALFSISFQRVLLITMFLNANYINNVEVCTRCFVVGYKLSWEKYTGDMLEMEVYIKFMRLQIPNKACRITSLAIAFVPTVFCSLTFHDAQLHAQVIETNKRLETKDGLSRASFWREHLLLIWLFSTQLSWRRKEKKKNMFVTYNWKVMARLALTQTCMAW